MGVLTWQFLNRKLFIRYVSHGVPVSFHAAVVTLDHATADGVLDGIKTALEMNDISYEKLVSHDCEGPKLVSANFDGASVMMGNRSGVAGKITREAPYVVPVHCVAHKLELSVLDAVMGLLPLKIFEEVLKQIFKFYHNSPQMRRELKTISQIFETDLVHLSDVKNVRCFASKERAVRALRTSLHSVIQHFETVATGRTEQSSKAKGWLAKIKTVTFIKTLFILLDVLPLLTEVSLVFQKEDLLVTTLSQEIEGVMLKLTQLKVQPETGENLKAFMDLYAPQDGTFDGVIQLIGQSKHVNFKQDMFFNSLIDGIVKYIDKRFECFSQAPLKYFKVLDYTEWPTDRCSLSVYGCEEIDALLEHYHPLFTDEEKTRIKDEFTTLKGYLKNCKKTVYDC
ncbi:zinc finger protein 862-like [Haliotis asinina]|uniref:zinc finger protein 862-like n=1 Tax=Haliotis asinina TaxID=109174 RepID=UPI0035325CB7